VRKPRGGFLSIRESERQLLCTGNQRTDLVCVEPRRSALVSVARFAFQACSFNHSDISPSLESYTCGEPGIHNCLNCDTSLNLLRSLRAILTSRTVIPLLEAFSLVMKYWPTSLLRSTSEFTFACDMNMLVGRCRMRSSVRGELGRTL
jgi:hypothetical protein